MPFLHMPCWPLHALHSVSIHLTQQLLFQNVLALFILLRALVRAIIFPTHNLFALSTADVADDVSACRHVTLAGLALLDVYDAVEEVGFAVLAAEVLGEEVRRGRRV